MEEDKIYWCRNCSAEFDPFADDVTILHESHGVIVIQDRSRRAHSLTLTTWNKLKRTRELEDCARPINPSNLYQEQDSEREQYAEGQESADGINPPDTGFQEAEGEAASETDDQGFREAVFIQDESAVKES